MENNNKELNGIKMMIDDGIVTQEAAEKYFPELKESEDEKIKRILHSISSKMSFHLRDIFTEEEYQCFDAWSNAWLERQGEHKSIWHNENEEPQRDSLILLILQSGIPIVAKIIEPNHSFNHGEKWAYINDLLEKQGNPTSVNIDKMVMDYSQTKDGDFGLPVNCMIRAYRQGIIDVLNLSLGIEKENEQILANSTKACKDEQKTVEWHREDEQNLNTCLSHIPDEYLRRWLVDVVHVKYDKPADKVESKFKIGDKIIGIVSGIPYYITEVCNDHYFTETGCCIMFNAQNNFKLYEQKPVDSYCQENCKGFKETGKCFADEDCKAKREAESVNKVEPKFHEKDWIVNKDGRIFQIMRVDNDFNHITYACRPIEENSRDWASYSENKIRLWDITKDAKAGDVLNSVRVKATIIFKKWNSDGKHINAYCALQKGILIKQEMLWDRDFEPATKEQRDALKKAIVDAGYTFDFEKKELKKIEQNPAWSEEDEIRLKHILH